MEEDICKNQTPFKFLVYLENPIFRRFSKKVYETPPNLPYIQVMSLYLPCVLCTLCTPIFVINCWLFFTKKKNNVKINNYEGKLFVCVTNLASLDNFIRGCMDKTFRIRNCAFTRNFCNDHSDSVPQCYLKRRTTIDCH
jgi:amino acid permease